MSNDWRIKSNGENIVSAVLGAVTFGLMSGGTRTYEVENEDGTTKYVRASDEEEVFEKIADGDFEEED